MAFAFTAMILGLKKKYSIYDNTEEKVCGLRWFYSSGTIPIHFLNIKTNSKGRKNILTKFIARILLYLDNLFFRRIMPLPCFIIPNVLVKSKRGFVAGLIYIEHHRAILNPVDSTSYYFYILLTH